MDSANWLADAVGAMRLIDLTHPLKVGMPAWPTHPHYCQQVVESFDRGDVACNHALTLCEHTGTHFDAPLHFVPGGASIADVAPDRFFGRMVTISLTGLKPRTAVQPGALLDWEARHGPIVAGDAVFFHFGWDRYWTDPRHHAEFLSEWPGLSAAACMLLLERGVRLVGCDCLSIDCFGSTEFPAHRTLLGAGILIGENFANLGAAPPVCALVTLPLPIVNGSGAPLRAFAFAPRGD